MEPELGCGDKPLEFWTTNIVRIIRRNLFKEKLNWTSEEILIKNIFKKFSRRILRIFQKDFAASVWFLTQFQKVLFSLWIAFGQICPCVWHGSESFGWKDWWSYEMFLNGIESSLLSQLHVKEAYFQQLRYQ